MEKSFSESYKASGVDITTGYKAVELMKEHVARTRTENVMDEIGGFGGALDISGEDGNVLVSGTDGVGTKLKLAFMLDRHDSVGIDCVAMCVNDVICTGAKPLLFLDYIACGRNVPERIASIVKGVAEGCIQAGCALVGGETAEMPGFYPENEYDLAGFSVGIVRKDRMLDKNNVKKGDLIIALASSGVHSNGFSLIRKIFSLDEGLDRAGKITAGGRPLPEALIEPTKIYVKPVLSLLSAVEVHSISHITGGGFYENIPRSLPSGCTAVIERSKLRTPELFSIIQKEGNISDHDMFNTFNMGVGMMLTVREKDADRALSVLNGFPSFEAYVTGHVESGETGVVLC